MTAETSKTHKSTTEKIVKKREANPPATQETLAPEQVSLAAIFQQASADPRTLTSNHVLQLQRAAGNQAVGQLIQRPQNRVQPTVQMKGVPINDDEELEQEADTMGTIARYPLQAKLTVGAANDSYEQEADRVAAQVISTPAQAPAIQRQGEEEEEIQTKPLAASITPLIQRQPLAEEEEEPLQGKLIQRQSLEEEEEEPLQGKFIPGRETFTPGADFESRLAATRAGGSPLPKSTRSFMEKRFGADFDGVRLHTGSESAQLNREVSAQAFTRGHDIYLGEGRESVESNAGKQLLAHELTHVIQQGGFAGEATSLQRLGAIPEKMIEQIGPTCGLYSLLHAIRIIDPARRGDEEYVINKLWESANRIGTKAGEIFDATKMVKIANLMGYSGEVVQYTNATEFTAGLANSGKKAVLIPWSVKTAYGIQQDVSPTTLAHWSIVTGYDATQAKVRLEDPNGVMHALSVSQLLGYNQELGAEYNWDELFHSGLMSEADYQEASGMIRGGISNPAGVKKPTGKEPLALKGTMVYIWGAMQEFEETSASPSSATVSTTALTPSAQPSQPAASAATSPQNVPAVPAASTSTEQATAVQSPASGTAKGPSPDLLAGIKEANQWMSEQDIEYDKAFVNQTR